MTELWVDFRGVAANWDTFVVALKKRGIAGVIRYIDAGSDSKQIHRAEYQAYVRGGIKVLLVDELGTGDAWVDDDDRAAGVARARAARADARGEGIPDSVAIFCAADAHASGRQITDAVAYASGFASVLGKSVSGFYGFVETSVAVHNAGVVSLHWRCGSRPSTADRKWVTFWQRNTGTEVIGGIQCDINERYGAVPQEEDVDAQDVWSWSNEKLDTRDMRQIVADAESAAKKAASATTALLAAVKPLAAKVDALAAKLDSIATGGGAFDYAALAKAMADETDRRGRDGDPSTGPVT